MQRAIQLKLLSAITPPKIRDFAGAFSQNPKCHRLDKAHALQISKMEAPFDEIASSANVKMSSAIELPASARSEDLDTEPQL